MKTTAKHFEYFKKRCLYWADKFSLDWELRFRHGDREGKTDFRALVSRKYLGNYAHIFLNPDWGNLDYDIPSDETLDYCAKHEILHVLIADIAILASSRYVTEDEVTKAEEALVVKLCKLL